MGFARRGIAAKRLGFTLIRLMPDQLFHVFVIGHNA